MIVDADAGLQHFSTTCHAEALQLTSLLASDVAKWLGSLNVAGEAPGRHHALSIELYKGYIDLYMAL